MTTIPEEFFKIAQKFNYKTALQYKKEGIYFPMSYKSLAKDIAKLSVFLQKSGLQKGDRAAILSENRPEWVMADIATMKCGGIVVPLHSTFSPEVISLILKHSGAKFVFVSNGELLNKILLGKRNFQKIIFFGKLTNGQKKRLGNKVVIFKRILQVRHNFKFQKVNLSTEDCCTIIYTSGTTGDPKGAMLSHKNILSNIESVLQAVPVKETDLFLSFLPLSHVFERTIGYYAPILSGATIAYAESIKQLPYDLKEISPTIIVSVPRIFEKFQDAIWDKVNASNVKKKLFKWALRQKKESILYWAADFLVLKKIRDRMGGKLRFTVCGGASLNENVFKFFHKVGILILSGYGLTETAPVVTANREKNFKFGTVGQNIQGVHVKISPQKEILVKGPNVFRGYFNNEGANKLAFDGEGWFQTGDLGFVDKDKFLTIIGRKKEMLLLSNGKNIWPEVIENLLNDDRFISQSVVVGDKEKFVSALIVPDWQEVREHLKKQKLPLLSHYQMTKGPAITSLFQQRLDEKINPKLSDFEKIKNFKLLASEFSQENEELTPTLKLRRHIIYRRYKRDIRAMYE